MTANIGIDLGTSNSAISSFDGARLQVYRSPDQTFVTPSVIHFGPRGKLYGSRAYQMAAFDAGRTATSFKRFMGTSTPILLPAAGVSLSPEECSAEILKVLFGYLPEELRKGDTGTVVTVPAAFNQMQRDATLSAAELAGIGKVALMQEPVAAVMAVVRNRKSDGTFLIYDLGGGTFDVAVSQSAGNRVTLLDHGGIAMCGGRDIDRAIVERVVLPWMRQQFALPADVATSQDYARFRSIVAWAAERAKIELSAREQATISLQEGELRTKDGAGVDMYVEAPLSRGDLDALLQPLIESTVQATRDVLTAAHLTSEDVERIVFVGGPTQYKPLRDAVAAALQLPSDTQTDPMTAVAEGAALFAESVDWTSERRGRKGTKGTTRGDSPIKVTFEYIARTPDVRTRVVARGTEAIPNDCEWQVDNLDTGWSSGRMPLKLAAGVDLDLTRDGQNHFKVFVFQGAQGSILQSDAIVVTRTPVSVDGIPASHSIGVAVKERLSGSATKMRWLVRKGDSLPRNGKVPFRAGEALRAGGPGALVFNLYEGEIESPPEDNRLVGSFKIEGRDLATGVIQPGDELLCEYEAADSGRLSLSVSVASVAGTFSPGHEFYSRQEGLIDFTVAGKTLTDECAALRQRAASLSQKLSDGRLEGVANRVDRAEEQAMRSHDPEIIKLASEAVLEARRTLSQVRRDHLETAREADIDRVVEWFDKVRELAKPAEVSSFDNLARSARRVIAHKTGEFEQLLDEMRRVTFDVYWRQDWWVLQWFEAFRAQIHRFNDVVMFKRLIAVGEDAIQKDEMQRLREVVAELHSRRISVDPGDDPTASVNIL
jgi:molecular chaperone DnaK